MALVISLLFGVILLMCACKAKTTAGVAYSTGAPTTTWQSIVPYIPPSYYQCISVLPMVLENAFYSNYGNTAAADAMYDGQIFVFKDLLVDGWMIKDVNRGWLWADLTKCPIINLDAAKQLKSGDRIDIVGICEGRDPSQSGGLFFENCYVLQANSIQLPAPGGGSTFAPSY